ncbi:hypothetical protein BDW62DRAFT_199841 [Aspergillus aurantiobrunneus]
MSLVARPTQSLFLGFLTLVSGLPTSSVPAAQPTDVSVTPSFVSNVFQNTHTSTVGSNGQATPVPIVGGPECWFCPKEDEHHAGSWALLGLDKPGTYQPSSVSAQFDQPLPVINVTADGDPVYGAPTRTIHETATKARRAGAVPTETMVRTDEYFDLLRQYMPHTEEDLPNGARFAMTAKTWNRRFGIKIPRHYNLFTGSIIDNADHEDVKCNGELVKVIEYHDYEWRTTAWDLVRDENNKVDYQGTDKELIFYEDRDDAELKFLGRLRDDATDEVIHETAKGLVNEMNKRGGYDYFLRNCRDFAYLLFKRIRQK